ncbi:cadherin repeat domain-containing protein [Cylindrospermopsis curvispora]|uniref:Cadherin repeat domain-containing protein n=4 Tax=Cylindrospermopsis TaxID=77021 RepID=A0A7H0F4M5_9CYAN|nr:cadherin repeat domain-containing protein [Cylindrospermopsis curvispora]QNP30991.1 cadherin repeat domain-containing protein [Cylindrospermopsis curvispora GIHE-G1]
MALQLKLQLFTNNNGLIGDPINEVPFENSFFLQILAGDFRSDAEGLIGFVTDLQWQPGQIQALDDPFDPKTLVTSSFPLFVGGTLDKTLGLINDLTGGSLPEFGRGEAIGIKKWEPFANLLFQAISTKIINVTDFTLTPDLSNLSFADGYINNAPIISDPGIVLENSNPTILTVSDPNPSDILIFKITGGADQQWFTLNTNGELLFNLSENQSPDYENPLDSDQNNSYQVEITAYDNFGELKFGNLENTVLGVTTVRMLIIEVINVNETPTNISLNTTTVDENTPTNTVIGTFSTTDPDAGNTFTYSLVGGDTDNSVFSIVDNQLQINNSPDFETKSSYSIRVKTTDQDGLEFEKTLTITVNNLNEAPTFPSGIATFSSVENSTLVGMITAATDPDEDTLTYSIGGADTNKFNFDTSNRVLSFKTAPDFEASGSAVGTNVYTVTVTATDGAGLTATQAVTVNVTDVVEVGNPPLITSSSTFFVAENSTVVEAITATDANLEDILTYIISGGLDQSLFTIDANTGVLGFVTAPDFEAPGDTGTDNFYNLQIQVTDSKNPVTQDLIVAVNNLNEAPTDIILININLDENVPINTVIGAFSTTDPDAGNTFTYSLVGGGADNPVFSIIDNQLQINNSPDFETKSSYSIRVKTTDQDGLEFEKTLGITVNNLNEAPTDIILDNFSVDENVPINTVIGAFSTTDPDAGNTFTYSLVGGGADNPVFSIVGNQLQINNSPDFETKSSYSIRVKTTDQDGLEFEKTLGITVNNLNEAPTDIILDNFSVDENVPINTVIGAFSTTDPDAGNTFTYSLVGGGADNPVFSIVGNQLQINNSPDFETKSSYSIRVKTTDQDGLEFEKTLGITVNNLNEAPTDIILDNFSVDENVPINTVIGAFSTTDPDARNTFTYSLVGGGADNPVFSIVGNQLQINNSPDFETKSSYSIRVKTTDQDGLEFEKTLGITVNNLNETLTITDSSGDVNDRSIEFTTPLSKFRNNATDSVFIRPSYPDTEQYVNLTNNGSVVLTVFGIQVNAPNVTIDYNFGTQGNLFLNPGQTQKIQLKYAPTGARENFNQGNGLIITSNSDNLPIAQVSLRGKSTFNGDLSYDGKVSFGDLGPLTANWDRTSITTPWDPTADINGDGKVGFGDLGQLTAQWNQSVF